MLWESFGCQLCDTNSTQKRLSNLSCVQKAQDVTGVAECESNGDNAGWKTRVHARQHTTWGGGSTQGLEWLCMDLKFNSTFKKHKFRWQSFDVWADQRQLGWETLTARYDLWKSLWLIGVSGTTITSRKHELLIHGTWTNQNDKRKPVSFEFRAAVCEFCFSCRWHWIEIPNMTFTPLSHRQIGHVTHWLEGGISTEASEPFVSELQGCSWEEKRTLTNIHRRWWSRGYKTEYNREHQMQVNNAWLDFKNASHQMFHWRAKLHANNCLKTCWRWRFLQISGVRQ